MIVVQVLRPFVDLCIFVAGEKGINYALHYRYTFLIDNTGFECNQYVIHDSVDVSLCANFIVNNDGRFESRPKEIKRLVLLHLDSIT